MAGTTDAAVRLAQPPAGRLALATRIAIAVPLALLAGAWSFQIWGGLFPCEMCWWQRYGHIAALVFAVLALLVGDLRARIVLVALAGLGISSSALIAGFHAGIEYHWWQGFTACTSLVKFDGGDPLAAIMSSPAVRCDEVQWQLAGISLAGFNFLISGLAAVVIFTLLASSAKRRPA
jgi:disulfide bond formation protein DsbB